jgi:hypothetical protein
VCGISKETRSGERKTRLATGRRSHLCPAWAWLQPRSVTRLVSLVSARWDSGSLCGLPCSSHPLIPRKLSRFTSSHYFTYYPFNQLTAYCACVACLTPVVWSPLFFLFFFSFPFFLPSLSRLTGLWCGARSAAHRRRESFSRRRKERGFGFA